jgi:hypothetical protein
MSTYLGDPSDHGYTSIPMSKSPSPTSNTTIPTSPEEISLMEGLEDISPLVGLEGIHTQLYNGIPKMRKIIKSQFAKLEKGDSDQGYLIFECVTVDDLTKIDRARNSIGKRTRMAHYTDRDLLIVKLLTATHERAHGNLAMHVIMKCVLMGIPGNEMDSMGATQYLGRRSSKEGDSAYKPYSRRPNVTDWPTIVFEAGFSESLAHLRYDAEWWLKHSGGEVKIVIIILTKPAQSKIQIEKWELRPMTGRRPILRSASNTLNNLPPQTPTKIQEIIIDGDTVTGAPLVLEFAKIFLRQPVPPQSDITCTGQELSDWAARLAK